MLDASGPPEMRTENTMYVAGSKALHNRPLSPPGFGSAKYTLCGRGYQTHRRCVTRSRDVIILVASMARSRGNPNRFSWDGSGAVCPSWGDPRLEMGGVPPEVGE